jgi:peptidoglycan/LPS O-acetylase OafA/YrhL
MECRRIGTTTTPRVARPELRVNPRRTASTHDRRLTDGSCGDLQRLRRAEIYWLAPSVILDRIDTRTIVIAPALIGLCFGAMVLAAVSGSGSYSRVLGRRIWRPLATGSYTLYLTHMMVLPMAGVFAAMLPLAPGASLTARWLAFVPWYLALSSGAAFVLHRYIERPVLIWRDRRLRSADLPHPREVPRAA